MEKMGIWVGCNTNNPEGFEGSFDGSVGETGLFELEIVSHWPLVLASGLRIFGFWFL